MVRNFTLELAQHTRGFHLITEEIEKVISGLPNSGLLHVFIQHTSAGLTINENCDPSVREDFNTSFNNLIKEDERFYTHVLEGSDDMPAHIKTALVGTSVSIPIIKGKLALGIWQGVYLCEFRNDGGHRKLILSVIE